MAQQAEVLSLSSVPGIHKQEGENQLTREQAAL